MLGAYELTPGTLAEMDDNELLKHKTHYVDVAEYCAGVAGHWNEALEAMTDRASEAARRWAASQQDGNARTLTTLTRAAQMCCTELKRRESVNLASAHEAHVLMEAAEILESQTMHDAAETCRVLAGCEPRLEPYDDRGVEATVGAGL